MNKQTIESALRAALQVLGILITLNIGGDLIVAIQGSLEYALSSIDLAIEAGKTLFGIAITLYGFFSDLKKPLTLSARWAHREVGEVVTKKAAVKGLTAKEYLAKAA